MNDREERMVKEAVTAYFMYYAGILLEELR
jgi:hypothetical protein